MRKIGWILALVVSGCFSPNYESGHLQCTADGQCPPGFYCAGNGHCYKNGTSPDLAVGGGPGTDMGHSVEEDMAQTPPDLTPPPPVVFPPAAVFIPGGGGGGTAPSGNQVNISIGPWSTPGVLNGSKGAQLTLGYFAEDTIP
jgi:hypothetical protein